MRASQFLIATLKETPADAVVTSHQLMLRAGMIKQQAAGIYTWLPLGFKVLRKIENIVHEEQIRAGHIPMLMPTLQSAERGSYPELMCATEPELDQTAFYGPTGRGYFKGPVGECKLEPHAKDKAVMEKLWEVSENATNFKWNL